MVTHRSAKKNARAWAAAAAIALLAAGCAGKQEPGYASAYVQALQNHPGEVVPTPEMLERFVHHFTHLSGAAQTTTESVYAADLYFSDTLLTTQSRAALIRHIDALRDNGAEVEIRILDTIISDADVYLVWAMNATFTPVRKTVTSNTIGISHLRFNADGQVVLHQDFWDSAAGFYRYVPIIGAMINNIDGSFEDHAD